MFKHWEKRVCNYFVKNDIIPEENQELYEYGLVQGCIIIVNIIITLLLGLLLNSVWQSIVFTAVYVPLRTYAGGYHAKTQGGCYFASICLIICVLTAIKFVEPSILSMMIMICLSTMVLYRAIPIENENKPLDQEEKVKYRRTVFLIFAIYVCILFLTYFIGIKLLAISIFYSLSAVVGMAVIEIIKQKLR